MHKSAVMQVKIMVCVIKTSCKGRGLQPWLLCWNSKLQGGIGLNLNKLPRILITIHKTNILQLLSCRKVECFPCISHRRKRWTKQVCHLYYILWVKALHNRHSWQGRLTAVKMEGNAVCWPNRDIPRFSPFLDCWLMVQRLRILSSSKMKIYFP